MICITNGIYNSGKLLVVMKLEDYLGFNIVNDEDWEK